MDVERDMSVLQERNKKIVSWTVHLEESTRHVDKMVTALVLIVHLLTADCKDHVSQAGLMATELHDMVQNVGVLQSEAIHMH